MIAAIIGGAAYVHDSITTTLQNVYFKPMHMYNNEACCLWDNPGANVPATAEYLE